MYFTISRVMVLSCDMIYTHQRFTNAHREKIAHISSFSIGIDEPIRLVVKKAGASSGLKGTIAWILSQFR